MDPVLSYVLFVFLTAVIVACLETLIVRLFNAIVEYFSVRSACKAVPKDE